MHLMCLGISHETAGIADREQVALDSDQADALVARVLKVSPKAEMVVLSTCNRTEVYLARPLHESPNTDELTDWLLGKHNTPQMRARLYKHEKSNALRHLFEVCVGLDSMVIGETQIVSQLKNAYQHAIEVGGARRVMHKLFQSAFSTGKKIRSQTALGSLRLSVSSAAVDFASQLFDNLGDKTICLVGAGEMGELTMRHFSNLHPGRMLVVNRSIEKAEALAETFSAETRRFEDLNQAMVASDIVIFSTGSKEPIVHAKSLRPLLYQRRYRPLFLIDIAAPRDVDPSVGAEQNVYLFDLDDLQASLEERRDSMAGELNQAHRIIDQSVGETYAMIQTRDFNHLIKTLRHHMHDIGVSENERTIKRLRHASPEVAEAILEEHTHRVINKILHRPISELGRQTGAQSALYAAAIRRLFDLSEEELSADEINLDDLLTNLDINNTMDDVNQR